LGPGGTERAAVNYAMGYKQIGQDSRFLVIYEGHQERRRQLEDKNIPLYEFYLGSKIIDDIILWSPDVIHFHRSNTVNSKVKRCIEIIKKHTHCLVLETNVFSRYVYDNWYKNVDISFQLSDWCLWKYRKWRGKKNWPFSATMPYAIEKDSFYKEHQSRIVSFKKTYNIPLTDFVAGRLGQAHNSKWHPSIVSLFEKVYRKYPQTTLLLVAPSPEVRLKVEQLNPQIRTKIKIIDRLMGDDQLRLYYSCLDVFIHHARIGESFGYVLVEAMLCGCPVITVATPFKDNSQVEVIASNKGGIVVNQQKFLIDAFEKIYHQVNKMEEACLLTSNHYNLNNVCQRIISLINLYLSNNASEVVTLKPDIIYDQYGMKFPKWLHIPLYLIHIGWLYKLLSKMKSTLIKLPRA
jgi:glycosyltransferase involved in cell wall biosynthesis